jgi:hypothetical protein
LSTCEVSQVFEEVVCDEVSGVASDGTLEPVGKVFVMKFLTILLINWRKIFKDQLGLKISIRDGGMGQKPTVTKA